MSDQAPTGPRSSATGPPSTIAQIDLSALAHNVALTRQCLPAHCQILAVVKADAYGHGAVMVSHTLTEVGITRLGVATVEEGVTLREAGIRAPIVVMGALFPGQLPDLIAYGLTPVVYDPATVGELARAARSQPEPYPVHIKVDTGMGRLGLTPETVLTVIQSPPFKGPLRLEGLMTHLADADSDDEAYTTEQLTRFRSVLRQLETAGISFPLVHAANSAAILCYPAAHFSMVRPGIMLYGYHTARRCGTAPLLKPVLSLHTRLVQIRNVASGQSVSYNRSYIASRPSRIAVLPIGYADGYSRSLSNKSAALIRGRRANLVGRVCMDMAMVDVTEIPDARPGDEATLIGQQGAEHISATDLATWSGTIPYEVLCAIGPRVTRVYRHAQPDSP